MADRDPELRVVAASRRSGRSGLTVGAALAVLLALVVGAVVGRATTPSHDSSRSPRSASDTGPERSVSGVPLGYAHTREGAVAAALSYGAVSARADFLDPARRAAVLGLIATPAFARAFEAQAEAGLAAALRGPLGQGLRQRRPTVYESAPLAYRVVSYTPHKAVIRGWGVALSGNTVGLAPTADFQTATSTLVWSDGDWKLAGGRAVEGPTPSLVRGVTRTPAGRFVQEIAAMRGVRHAP